MRAAEFVDSERGREQPRHDLRLGEADIVQRTLGKAREMLFDLLLAEPERRRRPAVEFRRIFAHRIIAARPDIVENAGDDIANPPVIRRRRVRADSRFDDANRHVETPPETRAKIAH